MPKRSRQLRVHDDEHAPDFDLSLLDVNFFASDNDDFEFLDTDYHDIDDNIIEEVPKIPWTHSENVRALKSEFDRTLDIWLQQIVSATVVGGRKCEDLACSSSAEFICFCCLSLPVLCRDHARCHFDTFRCEAIVHSISYEHVLSTEMEKSSTSSGIDSILEMDDDPTPEEKTEEECRLNPKILYFGISGWYEAEKPSSTKNLMENLYFPSSTKRPKAGFHLKLLEMCRSLYTIGHLSFRRIWDFLKDFWKTKPPGDYYGPFTVALRQFMRARHLMDNFRISLIDSEKSWSRSIQMPLL